MRTPRFIATILVVIIAPFSLSAQTLESLKGDPKNAGSFDYCDWHYSKNGNADEVAYFQDLLDNENGSELEIAAAVYVTAGSTVAVHAKDFENCEKTFSKGEKKYSKAYSKALKKIRNRSRFKKSTDEKIAAVQDGINQLRNTDQARRRAAIDMTTEDSLGSDFWARRMGIAEAVQIDKKSTEYMKELLTEYDWIDSHRFGDRISSYAWILVQHADDHRDFQADVLKRMEKYLENGGVSKSNYAYLYDRVAVNHDRPQRYGTQPTWECTDTGLVWAPMEDPENVNKRREEMGMGTAEEQLAEMTKSVCG